MCIYETNSPCDFTTLPGTKKNFYVAALGNYLNRCYSGPNRALCACNTDRCNGNFELMLKYWLATKHTNVKQKDCVAEYLRKKTNLVATASSNAFTTKELKSVKTTASKKTTKSVSLLTSNSRSMPKLVVKSQAVTSTSQTAGTPLASKTIVEETDAPSTDKSDATGTTDEPSNLAPEPDAAVKSDSNPKKPKKRGTLTKFLIYAAICIGIVILVCLVIPVLVVYVFMKKRNKVPKAAVQNKGQTKTASTSSTTNTQQTKKSFWKKDGKEKQSAAGKPTKKSQAGNIAGKY